MNCFYCGKLIEKGMGEAHFIPLEKPYINLTFHNDCYKEVKAYGEQNFLQENTDEIYKLVGGKK